MSVEDLVDLLESRNYSAFREAVDDTSDRILAKLLRVIMNDETLVRHLGRTVEEKNKVLNLELVDYSDKSMALFGDTKEIKDELMTLKLRFNPALTYEGRKRPGWIVSKRNKDSIRKIEKIIEDYS